MQREFSASLLFFSLHFFLHLAKKKKRNAYEKTMVQVSRSSEYSYVWVERTINNQRIL